MVLPLIDPGCRNLAGPPSLDSCTRDVYASDAEFNLSTVLGIALGVASAARHLHARGLMHGDLYAHNILHDAYNQVYLGDFGAASFLAQQDATHALALQRMEVRAFGLLLQELTQRCPAEAASGATQQALSHLAVACSHHTPTRRPVFDEIERELRTLKIKCAPR